MAGTAGGILSGTGSGTLSGIVSGVFWGAVVGGLVLMLAALVLDLGRGPGGPDPAADGGGVAVARDGISPAPVLLQRLDLFGPPDPADATPRAPTDPRRSLVPRPAQPVLPRLVTGGAVPVPDADVPVVPPAPVGMARVTPPDIPGMPGSGPAPGRVLPLAAPPVGAVPSRPSAAAQARAMLPEPAAPGPLIAAPSPPRLGGPPGAPRMETAPPGPAEAVPVRDGVAPLGDVAAQGRPPASPELPAPPEPRPRVAFILDGPTDAPVPDWLRGRVTQGDGAALLLDRGGAVVADANTAAAYLAARANGMPALLAYARLDVVDDILLDRIALHARRDGAVAVLVAPDPALWARIGVWLNGPARDLVPVDAATLLE